MKRILWIVLLLIAGPALTQDSELLKGEALKAEVEKNCADGCILFNQKEIDAFDELLKSVVQAREQAAYQAGLEQGAKACREKGRGA